MLTETEIINIYKCLTDPNRMQILKMLQVDKALCADEILEQLEIAQSTLSHHMKALTHAKIVDVSRKGKRAYYTMNVQVFQEMKKISEKIFNC